MPEPDPQHRAPLYDRPDSPCIGVCALDDDDSCLGCRRTRVEIALWTRMTPAQQWAVVRELPERIPP